MMQQTLVILSTVPEPEIAEKIAELLVSEKLAACVQIIPGIKSIYRWENKIEKAQEWLLIIKTTRRCLAALSSKIESVHPYDVPEVVALETVGGLESYLSWVEKETTASKQE